MTETSLRRLAKPMLLSAAFIWGTSFVVMKTSLEVFPLYLLLAIRFAVGGILLSLLCRKHWRSFSWDMLWRGAIVGALLTIAYVVQSYGLMRITPSKNAFLTAFYSILVPFFCWLVVGRKPDRWNIIAACLGVTGVGLISLSEQLTVQSGDCLTLLSAVFYAAHITAVQKLSQDKDIYLLTIFQFVFCAIYCTIGSVVERESLPVLTGGDWLSLLYLAVFATTIALLFQNVGQMHSNPATTALLLSLESVFGTLCGVLFYGDPLTLRLVCGFCVIFLAVLCSETKLAFLRRTTERREKGV